MIKIYEVLTAFFSMKYFQKKKIQKKNYEQTSYSHLWELFSAKKKLKLYVLFICLSCLRVYNIILNLWI
jgi:hypothetical protein